jgi:hypothetical protein
MHTEIKSLTVCLLIGVLSTTLHATDVAPPVSERFTSQKTSAVPDFQQHVVPLLGRLGCNGRSCHGSFQGRGGLQLSLFGYDFMMDHEGLTGKATSENGLRVNSSAPGESLILQKPSLVIDHEGGQRFKPGSWEHHLLLRWVQSGAKGAEQPRELDRLEIEPAEIVFSDSAKVSNPPDPAQLRVVAHWINGDREDVTELCRFRTNDDSVATIDRDGMVKSAGPGDSHVVTFYDNGVAAVPVMRAFAVGQLAALTNVDPRFQEQATKIDGQVAKLSYENPIDRFVVAKLLKLGIVPSPVCTDAEFLRRVSIDLTGTLPAPVEITSFLADRSDGKRRRKIDELLKRPAYAAWWTNKLCDFTGCNPRGQAELGQETSVQWYMWIYKRVGENVPYDELIERIVLAKSRRDGQSYDDYAKQMTESYHDESAVHFQQRADMPHYWTRQTLKKPQDTALAFAHSFLGIRLQCAQCHKHPFAPWTQQDFQQFTEFFSNVKYGVIPQTDKRYRELAKQVGLNIRGKDGSPVRSDVLKRASFSGSTIPWRELYIAERKEAARLRLLRSRTVELATVDDPRESIMKWMKERDNNWFARAFVNRVWAGYFHIGIVDPPDDLNPANPPSNPELLNWLTAGFVENEYDMKWLHRQIVTSDTYQRSWKPNVTNREDRRNFSRVIPRRLPAEVVYDGIKQAVAGIDQLDEVRTDLTRRAIGHLSMRLAGTYAMDVFGKPDRAVNCDCERVNQPTLLQAIFLQNDPLVEQRIEESGWLAEVTAAEQADEKLDRRQLVQNAWLRTFNRPPTTAESERAMKHLAESESVSEGMRDVLWALLNAKEFILNR